jgi:hypothetical protein
MMSSAYDEPQAPPPQTYAAPAPAPEPAASDPYAELRELKKLLDEEIITEEEFAAQKAKILG